MNHPRTCLSCHARWEHLPKRRSTCPNGCSVESHREVRRCETCGQEWYRVPTKGQAPKSCDECRTSSGVRLRTVPCWVCGAPLLRTTQSNRYRRRVCPGRCKGLTQAGGLGRYPSRADFERATREPTPLTTFEGVCLHCAEPFTRELYAGSPPSYCSKRCRDRARASRREYRKRGASGVVHTGAIHDRDKWTCYLCGDPTDPDDWTMKLGRDGRLVRCVGPLYPTLDHVVPLAQGGPHTPDNVRTAHFLCNSLKRDL